MWRNQRSIWSLSPHDHKYPRFLEKLCSPVDPVSQAMDETHNRRPCCRNPIRYEPQPRRPDRGKRYAAATTHRPQSSSQTTSTDRTRPHSPGSLGPMYPVLAASPAHRPTRHAAPLAPRPLPPFLATQIKRQEEKTAHLPGNNRSDQANGQEKPSVGRETNPRSANGRFKSICPKIVETLARPGPPS